jgi:hypothetical protein
LAHVPWTVTVPQPGSTVPVLPVVPALVLPLLAVVPADVPVELFAEVVPEPLAEVPVEPEVVADVELLLVPVLPAVVVVLDDVVDDVVADVLEVVLVVVVVELVADVPPVLVEPCVPVVTADVVPFVPVVDVPPVLVELEELEQLTTSSAIATIPIQFFMCDSSPKEKKTSASNTAIRAKTVGRTSTLFHRVKANLTSSIDSPGRPEWALQPTGWLSGPSRLAAFSRAGP